MQLSNKLTFTLASLVVMLGLVFTTAQAVDLGTLTTITPSTAKAIPAGGHLIVYKGSLTTIDADFAGLPTLPPNTVYLQ